MYLNVSEVEQRFQVSMTIGEYIDFAVASIKQMLSEVRRLGIPAKLNLNEIERVNDDGDMNGLAWMMWADKAIPALCKETKRVQRQHAKAAA